MTSQQRAGGGGEDVLGPTQPCCSAATLRSWQNPTGVAKSPAVVPFLLELSVCVSTHVEGGRYSPITTAFELDQSASSSAKRSSRGSCKTHLILDCLLDSSRLGEPYIAQFL